MPTTNPTLGDSSNVPQQDASPPLLIIRLRIWPDGMQSFAPNLNACVQEITEVITSMYDHPWPSYTKILADTKAMVSEVDEHNLMIRKIFDHRAAKRLQQMMSDVRQGRDHLTSWVRPSIKKELEAHFRNDEGFKHRRLTNVAHRASPRSSKYTGGSTTFLKTKSRLEDYMKRLETTTQQSQPLSGNDEAGSETSVVDPDRIWRETTFEPHKNRCFKLGSFFANGLHSSALAASSASSSATSPTDLQEVVDLREEVQKLTQELH
ncbi:uncharacterized protein DS421_19g649060 [Arachis hypogaea]|uniref:Uncharacterized protein n=1 Tax=Arachis hypogaea TaxID=3818 RepID=A0A6B9V9W8_ARAHY|nr:uncharacterized protein DS421_19g649060 [Arachis hypogaea]